jgi:hypothetical protein
MKSANSTVASDTKKAVQGRFSHSYKVLGDGAQTKSGNVLALMQKRTENAPQKKK